MEEQRGLHSKVWEKWVAWNVLTSPGVWARVWPGLDPYPGHTSASSASPLSYLAPVG